MKREANNSDLVGCSLLNSYSSNGGGDGNESDKKALGLDSQNNNVHHSFLYISFPSPISARLNLTSCFVEDVNT